MTLISSHFLSLGRVCLTIEEKQLAIQEATESIAGQSLVGLVEKYERTKRGKYADILAPEQMDQARDLSLQEANELAERLQI